MADLYQVRNGELVPIMSISQCMPISGGQFTGGVFETAVTWPSSFRWTDGTPPELTPEGTDVLTFLTVNGGATWYGVPSLQGAA